MSSSAGSAASSNWRRELSLPVILHDREAHGDMLDTLTAFFPAGPGKMDRAGVLHCFSGSVEMADEMVRRGFFIVSAAPSPSKTPEGRWRWPLPFPWMPCCSKPTRPIWRRCPIAGKRCDSGMIAATAARIAEIRGMSAETLLGRTHENACRLFGISVA